MGKRWTVQSGEISETGLCEAIFAGLVAPFNGELPIVFLVGVMTALLNR